VSRAPTQSPVELDFLDYSPRFVSARGAVIARVALFAALAAANRSAKHGAR